MTTLLSTIVAIMFLASAAVMALVLRAAIKEMRTESESTSHANQH